MGTITSIEVNMKQIKFNGYDGAKIIATIWDEVKRPQGIVVLVHDLRETLSYYEPVAKWFNQQGFVVCGNILRLHGKQTDLPDDEFNDGTDYFKENVNDLYILTKIMKESFVGLPLTVVGVGFGSYLALRYLQICDFANFAVFVGMGYNQTLWFQATKPLGFVSHLFSKKNKFAKQMKNLMFAPMEQKHENKNYVTTNEKLFEKLSDEFAYNNILPLNYYYSFLNNLVTHDKNLSNINKNTKLLLMTGIHDTACKNGLHTKKMMMQLEDNGLTVTMQVWDEMKHNLLLETEYEEVLSDVLKFITNKKLE